MPMDRTEAVTYLKELLTLCDMSPESVSFEKSSDNDSAGYRVHIKGKIHESEKQRVRDVAKKYGLAVREELDGVMVYKLR
jgi:hypothetical protein